jgi:formamidopyrimidine-DNA glycosylase
VPELPDIAIYIEALEERIRGQTLERTRVASPFLVRTADPPVEAAQGRQVTQLRRLGKRIAIGFEPDLWLVLHLMIAGRLHWREKGAKLPGGRRGLAAFDFSNGTLVLTEAGSKKRASLHVVQGEDALRAMDPGGLEVLDSELDAFAARLTLRNHTLKRALTDPRLFSGIGNAYSDEILHRAGLSPIKLTQKLAAEEIERLYQATQTTLRHWVDTLRQEAGKFPEKVTAFREGMTVHGRYRQPCPVCGAPVQRIRYADNETNYCPGCQTGGRVLADRSLSRLLKEDWPRTLEELENLGRAGAGRP